MPVTDKTMLLLLNNIYLIEWVNGIILVTGFCTSWFAGCATCFIPDSVRDTSGLRNMLMKVGMKGERSCKTYFHLSFLSFQLLHTDMRYKCATQRKFNAYSIAGFIKKIKRAPENRNPS